MGRAIRDFCNHYAEKWEEVSLIRPHGQKREKETLAMPEPIFDAVKKHVKRRALNFGDRAQGVTSANDAHALAKDLGKYPQPLVSTQPFALFA